VVSKTVIHFLSDRLYKIKKINIYLETIFLKKFKFKKMSPWTAPKISRNFDFHLDGKKIFTFLVILKQLNS